MVNTKYLHLKQVAIESTVLFMVALVVMTILQIVDGVSISDLSFVFLVITSPLYLSALIMTCVFCELYDTKITRPIAALIFGALAPIIFFLLLSLSMFVLLGMRPHGYFSLGGLLLYLMIGGLSLTAYWLNSNSPKD